MKRKMKMKHYMEFVVTEIALRFALFAIIIWFLEICFWMLKRVESLKRSDNGKREDKFKRIGREKINSRTGWGH